jgi:putative transposase
MSLTKTPKGYRFSRSIISYAVWLYHRFNTSYRDIKEQLLYRGIDVSHETIRNWCYKFASYFEDVIKKKKFQVRDKWHLDEMTIRINGEYFILWRAVDADGYELDVFLQKRRNKKSAIRFLSRLLNSYEVATVFRTGYVI